MDNFNPIIIIFGIIVLVLFTLGRQVEILYNPSKSRINTFVQNGTAMIAIGIALLLISPFPTSTLLRLL